MTSFQAIAPVAPDKAPTPDVVKSDGWFPDVDLLRIRSVMRMDGTYSAERLRDAVVDAIATVNERLAAWARRQTAAGVTTLAAVPAATVDGDSVNVHRYFRAVANLAHADLAEKYRDTDTTRAGSDKAEAIEDTVANARRNATWALNDIQGRARSTISLV